MKSILLKLEGLEVNLGGKKILNGISLEIRKGDQWVILGASGAGKTVLARTWRGSIFFREP